MPNHVFNGIDDQILTQEEILAEIQLTISKVQSILPVCSDSCRILLQKYNWNVDTFRESYSSQKLETFLIEYGLFPKHIVPKQTECSICCSESDVIGLSCNHMACEECWRTYIKDRIENGQTLIECMDGTCNLAIKNVERFLEDSTLMTVYEDLIVKSYVEANPKLSFCPDCNKAVKRVFSYSKPAVCPCGSKFCISCAAPPHHPATCHQMKLWEKKMSTSSDSPSDQKTYEWMLTNTKDCPRCATSIVKNGGCNLMKCTNKKCRLNFCWQCLTGLDKHGLFCDKKTVAVERSRLNNRANLHHFLSHSNRFQAQEQYFEVDQKLIDRIHVKTAETDIVLMEKAMEVLLDSRQTLMHSYVFGYFLKRNSYSKAFEKYQSRLELASRQLSTALKAYLDDDTSNKLRKLVHDETRFVQNAQKVLLEHCAKGKEHEDLEGQGDADALNVNNAESTNWGELCALLAIFIFVAFVFSASWVVMSARGFF